MKDFIYHNPTKLIFGKKSMSLLVKNIKPFGKKVLLTYGQGSIKKNGIYRKVVNQLKGFMLKEFGGIEPNPRVETLRKAILRFKSFKPDIILAVGGGSVIDGSKLLSASFYYNGDPWDFLTKKVVPPKYIPLAVVLTVAATGSEMNCAAVISNFQKKEKLVLVDNNLYPRFSILDPQNTFSLSRLQTAYGIVDAFSHVLEQYLHTTKNAPLQDRFSEAILLTLIENSSIVLKKLKNYEARANVMFCATMALNDLIAKGVNEDWATHMIEHELSAFYDIPHGAGLAIVTPRWMEIIKEQKKEKFIQYGKRIWGLKGSDDQIVNQAIEKTIKFFKSLGIKMCLKDWGIDTKHFGTMVTRLAKKEVGEIALTRTQLKKILNNCHK